MRKQHKRKITKRTQRERQEKKKKRVKQGLIILGILMVVCIGIKIRHPGWLSNKYWEMQNEKVDASQPELDVQLLTVNPYSRPGTETNKIRGIVVHYVANPGSTAQENRDYFEGLKDTHVTQASSNFIVGLDGEIIQCVPTWEVAYASNSRNIDTVSIECCHPDETGEFTNETYRSLVQLCAWLCLKFDLDEEDVIRHYDVTGKNCPKYFVENEKVFLQFREDIHNAIENTEN